MGNSHEKSIKRHTAHEMKVSKQTTHRTPKKIINCNTEPYSLAGRNHKLPRPSKQRKSARIGTGRGEKDISL
jgi:hypothetical protein